MGSVDMADQVVQTTGMAARKDPLRYGLSERIWSAWDRHPRYGVGKSTEREAALAKAVGTSVRMIRKWLPAKEGTEPTTPSPSAIVGLSDALEVSTDWLLTGRDDLPSGYAEWLESDGGRSSAERQWLRSLPLHGYRAGPSFYRRALKYRPRQQAGEFTVAEVVQLVRATLAHDAES